ncbi:hypothetical protein A0J61_00692 [Choanephora cucurbitarum]|uniref:Uncharacterized protein n=1 Tax=Choanephora cucurbitarum TaxID=101091 RepID=A0A1C7NQS2_9FUNG|nr:hypothetical protein A0J61_00692 [Choanephora cucurbitarum]
MLYKVLTLELREIASLFQRAHAFVMIFFLVMSALIGGFEHYPNQSTELHRGFTVQSEVRSSRSRLDELPRFLLYPLSHQTSLLSNH